MCTQRLNDFTRLTQVMQSRRDAEQQSPFFLFSKLSQKKPLATPEAGKVSHIAAKPEANVVEHIESTLSQVLQPSSSSHLYNQQQAKDAAALSSAHVPTLSADFASRYEGEIATLAKRITGPWWDQRALDLASAVMARPSVTGARVRGR